MLQVRKVIEHVYEKVLGQGSDDGSQSAHNDSSRNDADPEDLAAAALEKVAIYCNDQVSNNLTAWRPQAGVMSYFRVKLATFVDLYVSYMISSCLYLLTHFLLLLYFID